MKKEKVKLPKVIKQSKVCEVCWEKMTLDGDMEILKYLLSNEACEHNLAN